MPVIDKAKILPSILIAVQIGAARAYIPSRDWRKVTYWLAAAILNVVVTF